MIQRADSNRKTLLALLVVLAGLLVLRYCAFGLSYYPQLDDYIQYCNYRQSTEPFWEMALRVGLLASRPLANIADYFIWSPLFDHMLVGVALVCVLYVACVGMVWSLLRRSGRPGFPGGNDPAASGYGGAILDVRLHPYCGRDVLWLSGGRDLCEMAGYRALVLAGGLSALTASALWVL